MRKKTLAIGGETQPRNLVMMRYIPKTLLQNFISEQETERSISK